MGVRVDYVGQEMLTLSGTPASLIHYNYIHYILLNLSVLGLCLRSLRVNDSGLFAWISLAILSLAYFIKVYMVLGVVWIKVYMVLGVVWITVYMVLGVVWITVYMVRV